jgi:hypothetical protein
MKTPPRPQELVDAYERYEWSGKHALYGYPVDTYPDFRWMSSLEQRFAWLKNNASTTSGAYLFREMIQWGGSQNGVLQKVDDGADRVCFSTTMNAVVVSLGQPAKALGAALDIPGIGLTYASKLLRFLDPDNYGALDSRIRSGLIERCGWDVKILDANHKSMISGYEKYLVELQRLRRALVGGKYKCPESGMSKSGKWRLADVEIALFQHLKK